MKTDKVIKKLNTKSKTIKSIYWQKRFEKLNINWMRMVILPCYMVILIVNGRYWAWARDD